MPSDDLPAAPPTLTFRDLALSEALIRALTDVGYESPSPIQAATIPHMLAGADVVMMASELLRRGPARVREIETELMAWMTAHEYSAIAQMRGSVASNAARDARSYERAQYIHNLLVHAGVVAR